MIIKPHIEIDADDVKHDTITLWNNESDKMPIIQLENNVYGRDRLFDISGITYYSCEQQFFN